MKKLFAYIGIFLVMAGVFAPLSTLHASGWSDCVAAGETQANCTTVYGPPTPYDQCIIAPGQTAATCKSVSGDPNEVSASSWLEWLNPGKWAPALLAFLGYQIMRLIGLLLALTGLLLNFILDLTVVHMAEKINAMKGINIAWRVFRDLMNITFIFILVY